MPIDYYLVLGIKRGANQSQIKRAYRKAIKRYHPDMVGIGTDPDKFIEAREAYEILSDIDRRRAYDAELKRQGVPIRITNIEETIGRRTAAWEELRGVSSFMDEFFEGFVPGLYRRRPRGHSIHKDLYLEVVLTPEEAQRGGIFPVTVPVMEPCPECRQSGWLDDFFCPSCMGHGAVKANREFKLTFPPNTQDGAVEAVLDGMGLKGARLFIDVRVRANPIA